MMKTILRRGVAVLLMSVAMAALGQSYPGRPGKIIVAFAPGGDSGAKAD